MNYQKIYDNLIKKAKSENRKKLKRDNPNYVYYEKHHILPKCLGGSDKKENLILLTAKEHFVSHKLLVKINSKDKGLIYAYWAMSNKVGSSKERNYKVSPREYERLRKELSIIVSEDLTGKVRLEKTKNKISKSNTGKKRTEEENKRNSIAQTGKKRTKESIEKTANKNRGQKRSQETKDKMSESSKGISPSAETRLKMSKSAKNKPPVSEETRKKLSEIHTGWVPSEEIRENMRRAAKIRSSTEEYKQEKREKILSDPKVTCLYCGKVGMVQNISRWHNEKCLLNPNKENCRYAIVINARNLFKKGDVLKIGKHKSKGSIEVLQNNNGCEIYPQHIRFITKEEYLSKLK